MAKDIVKEILIKFKSDSKGLNQDVKKIQDGLKSLEKATGGSSTSSLTKLTKSMSDFGKEASKVGTKVGKDFDKLQKSLKEIATKELQVLAKKTDELAAKAETRIKRLQELEKSGASPVQMKWARGRAEIANRRFTQSMDQFSQLSQASGGGAGGGGGGIMGVLGPLGRFMGPAAIASLPQLVAKVFDAQMDRFSNKAAVAAVPIQERLRSYSGDMTTAVLARHGVFQKAKEQEDLARKKGNTLTRGSLLAGVGLIGAGAAASLTGVGAAAGIPMMLAGAGAFGFGGYRAFTGATQKEAIDRNIQAREELSNALIDPKLYQMFRETATPRAQFQRGMGVGSDTMRDQIQESLSNRMSAEQYMGISQSLRGQIGGTEGARLAAKSGYFGLTYGVSAENAGQMLGAVGYGGKGGPKEAEKKLEEVFTKSVTAGFLDTGIREEFAKLSTSIQASSASKLDAGAISDNLLSYVKSNEGGPTMRDVNAARGARDFDESVFSGRDPLDNALNTASSINTLRKMGKPVTSTNIDMLQSMSLNDLEQGSDKTDMMGMSPEDRRQLLKNREGAMASKSKDVQNAINNIKTKAARGEAITSEDFTQLGMARVSAYEGPAGLKGRSAEELFATGSGMAQRLIGDLNMSPSATTLRSKVDKMTDENKKKAVLEYKTQTEGARSASPEQIEEGGQFGGLKKKEADINKTMTSEATKEMFKTQKEANEQVSTAGDSVDNLSEAANGAVESMNNFSDALSKLAKQINRTSGYGIGRPSQ